MTKEIKETKSSLCIIN